MNERTVRHVKGRIACVKAGLEAVARSLSTPVKEPNRA